MQASDLVILTTVRLVTYSLSTHSFYWAEATVQRNEGAMCPALPFKSNQVICWGWYVGLSTFNYLCSI